jgi:catechol 2,3-dioxygenase
MEIQSLGHVVLKVTDLERAEGFYSGLLGLNVCARYDENGMKMTFFSLGNHHDLALFQVPGGTAVEESAGLHHVAFCIGTTLDQLREAKAHLHAAGIETAPTDHDVTKSLYLHDPDGNMLEVYVDVSDGWRSNPDRIATVKPLAL